MGYVDSHTHLWFSSALAGLEEKVRSEVGSKLADLTVEEAVRTLDSANIEFAVIMAYPTRRLWGTTEEFPLRILEECGKYPGRFAVFGGVDMAQLSPQEVRGALELQYERGISGIKVHPPHMWVKPNAYRVEEGGLRQLEIVYEFAQDHGLPLTIHTGTSMFAAARNKYGDPIYSDDVAVDFPRLKIILAHMGRPNWVGTAFQLVRIRRNVYGEISGIPPKKLLEYLPRLEEIAEKTLYGSDYGSPGVKGIAENLEEFLAQPISQTAKNAMANTTPKSLIKPLER